MPDPSLRRGAGVVEARLFGRARPGRAGAFTLVEVLTSLVLASLVLGGVVYGYMLAARRAEWSAYSLAAQSLASMRVEQMRACKWDPKGWPPVDQLVASNFPQTIEVLDIPITGTNTVYATNTPIITLLSSAPPLKMVRVDCTWKFLDRGVFTNTVVTYRAPDQ